MLKAIAPSFTEMAKSLREVIGATSYEVAIDWRNSEGKRVHLAMRSQDDQYKILFLPGWLPKGSFTGCGTDDPTTNGLPESQDRVQELVNVVDGFTVQLNLGGYTERELTTELEQGITSLEMLDNFELRLEFKVCNRSKTLLTGEISANIMDVLRPSGMRQVIQATYGL